jgi:hypothetical protein
MGTFFKEKVINLGQGVVDNTTTNKSSIMSRDPSISHPTNFFMMISNNSLY